LEGVVANLKVAARGVVQIFTDRVATRSCLRAWGLGPFHIHQITSASEGFSY